MTKRIFFDTNIYNHLIERRDDGTELLECLRSAATNAEVELVIGFHVLKELLATNDQGKRRRLAECALKLNVGKVIKSWNQLIREEMQACLRGQKPPSIFCEERKQQFYCTVLKDISAGHFSDQCTRLREESKKEKAHALAWQNMLWQQEEPFAIPLSSQYLTFEAFYEQWRSASSNQVSKLLRVDRVGEPELKEAVLRVLSKQDRCPHLTAYLRVTPALCWTDHTGWKQGPCQRTGPKWGDRTDLRHVLCAATLDVLVSDDEKARAIFGHVYPGKMALTLKGFTATLGVQVDVP